VVGRLKQQGYLDDAEFARFWVENRQQFRPKGERALRQELRQKGVDEAIIQSAVADLDAEESAYAAARARALRLAALPDRDPLAFRRKLIEFLARRGFDYEVSQEVVERLARELGLEVPEEG